LNEAKSLHQKYWGAEQELVQSIPIKRDDTPIPLVIPLQAQQLEAHDFFPSGRAILIRDEYVNVIEAIEAQFKAAKHASFLICGHPGIGMCQTVGLCLESLFHFPTGKSLLLYYILCKRLKARQTTIIQPDKKLAFLFTSEGVKLTDPTKSVDFGVVVTKGTWYLFDASEASVTPPPMFYRERPTGLECFTIVAASPRRKYLADWEKRGGPHDKYYMRPFSLTELIQAWVQISMTMPPELTCMQS